MRAEREPRLGPLLRPGSLVDQVRGFARFSFMLFLLVAVALTTLLLLDVHRYGPHVRDSIEANRLLRLSHEAMLEQETSLRAFLLSGDNTFLVPYQEARAALARLTDRGRLPRPATRPAGVDRRMDRAALAEARRADDPDAHDRRTALLIEGRDLFDAYRQRHDAAIAEATSARERALDAQTDAIARVAGGTLVCTVLLGSFAAWRIRRLRLAVTGPVASILDHLSSIRSGDLTQERPDYIGLTELKIIDDGLTATARSLASAQGEASARAEELRAQNDQLAEVLKFAREVAGSLNLRYVLRGLCTATSAISGGRRVIIWLRPPDVAQVEAVADTDGPQLAPVGLAPIALGDGAVGRAAQLGRIEGRGTGSSTGGRTPTRCACRWSWVPRWPV